MNATTDQTYDQLVKSATQAISDIMDHLVTTHDGVQIYVNHWGRWVAKYKTHSGEVYYAFGPTLLDALNSLKDNPNKE